MTLKRDMEAIGNKMDVGQVDINVMGNDVALKFPAVLDKENGGRCIDSVWEEMMAVRSK